MKMRRILVTLAAFLGCWLAIVAQHMSEQDAMERALHYMRSDQSSAMVRRMASPAKGGGLKLTPVKIDANGIYAFNCEGGGFVIASGDQRTLPVLGYSDSGSIDWQQMPENMRSWLKQYDKSIATLGNRTDFENGEQMVIPSYGQGANAVRRSRRAERVAVEPLVKTHWDQNEPYWNQAPKFHGGNPSLQGKQCYVGCVATAMAQVMNFWQWPKTVPNGVPAYDYNNVYNGITKKWHIGALPPTWFDWDNMLNDYGYYDAQMNYIRLEATESQDNAVATLMRYCGQSVEMMYGPRELGGSGAMSQDIAKALTNYFDYNAAQFISRFDFGIDEWEGVIYGELAAGRPIVYGGSTDQSGHAFVCDGYDGNGLFHINWGWSGVDDGYFSLSVLNPYNNTSSGSGSSGIGFCIGEKAIIYTDPQMEQQPALHGEYEQMLYQCYPISIEEDNVVSFYYFFHGNTNEVIDNALGTIDEDGNLHPLFMVDPNDSILYSYLAYNYNYFPVQIDSTYFTPGQTVTLYPMLRFRHPGEQWQIVPPMEQNLTVGRDSDGKFFMISNVKEFDMELTGITITGGTGRLNERSDITIRVRNNESSDFSNILYLVPVYLGHVTPEEMGTVHPLAYGQDLKCGAYIPAKGEADVTFSYVPEYGGTVVFYVYNSDSRIGAMPLELNNDTLVNYYNYVENKSYLSREGDQWYWNVELADRIGTKMPHWIPADSLCLRVTLAFNNDVLQRVLVKEELRDYLRKLPDNIGNGEYTFNYQLPIDLTQPGDYYLDSYIAEIVNKERVSYCCTSVYGFTISDPTGINETVNAEPAEVEWYDLQGRRIANGQKPKANGVYIVNGKKIMVR